MQNANSRQNTPTTHLPPRVSRVAEWLFLVVGVLYALWELRHFVGQLRQRFSRRG